VKRSNRQKRAEYVKQYRLQHRLDINKYHRSYCRKHRKKINAQKEKYREKHVVELREYGKRFYQLHKSERNQYCRTRRKNDVRYKILMNLRNRVWYALRDFGAKKSDNTVKLIGCSADKLKKHIESKFLPGMDWNNYGRFGWHIDHIKPCAAFDLSSPEEQKMCFNYKNLQPLWYLDNFKKGSLYNGQLVKSNLLLATAYLPG